MTQSNIEHKYNLFHTAIKLGAGLFGANQTPKKRLIKITERILNGHGVDAKYKAIRTWVDNAWEPAVSPVENLGNTLIEFGAMPTLLKFEQISHEALESINYPAFLVLGAGDKLILAESLDDETLTVYFKRAELVDVKSILEDWDGVVIEIGRPEHTADEAPGKPFSFSLENISFLFLFAITAGLLLTGLVLTRPFHFTVPTIGVPLFLGIFNVVGLISSLILVQYYLGFQDNFVDKFCSQDKGTDCSAVLESKNSKIFGIPYADLGVIYFTSNLCLLLCYGPNSVLLFSSIALGSIFGVYSVVYQKYVAKTWCKYCLLTICSIYAQLLLVLSWPLFSNSYPWISISNVSFVEGALTIGFITMAWTWLRFGVSRLPKWIEVNDTWKQFINQTKDTSDIIFKRDSIEVSHFESDIVLGDGSDKNDVLLILSVTCSHCGELLSQFLELQNGYGEPFNLRIRLKTSDDYNPFAAQRGDLNPDNFVRLIALINSMKGSQDATESFISLVEAAPAIFRGLEEGEGRRIFSNWLDKYIPFYDDIDTSELERLHHDFKGCIDWVNDKEFPFTPLVIINGQLMHELYRGYEHIVAKKALIKF